MATSSRTTPSGAGGGGEIAHQVQTREHKPSTSSSMSSTSSSSSSVSRIKRRRVGERGGGVGGGDKKSNAKVHPDIGGEVASGGGGRGGGGDGKEEKRRGSKEDVEKKRRFDEERNIRERKREIQIANVERVLEGDRKSDVKDDVKERKMLRNDAKDIAEWEGEPIGLENLGGEALNAADYSDWQAYLRDYVNTLSRYELWKVITGDVSGRKDAELYFQRVYKKKLTLDTSTGAELRALIALWGEPLVGHRDALLATWVNRPSTRTFARHSHQCLLPTLDAYFPPIDSRITASPSLYSSLRSPSSSSSALAIHSTSQDVDAEQTRRAALFEYLASRGIDTPKALSLAPPDVWSHLTREVTGMSAVRRARLKRLLNVPMNRGEIALHYDEYVQPELVRDRVEAGTIAWEPWMQRGKPVTIRLTVAFQSVGKWNPVYPRRQALAGRGGFLEYVFARDGSLARSVKDSPSNHNFAFRGTIKLYSCANKQPRVQIVLDDNQFPWLPSSASATATTSISQRATRTTERNATFEEKKEEGEEEAEAEEEELGEGNGVDEKEQTQLDEQERTCWFSQATNAYGEVTWIAPGHELSTTLETLTIARAKTKPEPDLHRTSMCILPPTALVSELVQSLMVRGERVQVQRTSRARLPWTNVSTNWHIIKNPVVELEGRVLRGTVSTSLTRSSSLWVWVDGHAIEFTISCLPYDTTCATCALPSMTGRHIEAVEGRTIFNVDYTLPLLTPTHNRIERMRATLPGPLGQCEPLKDIIAQMLMFDF
jgi:hypothetical protein